MLLHRLARPDDVQLYFDWANDPETRQQSFQSDPIPFAAHQAWFSRKIADPNALLLVFEQDGQPVGQVRIEHSETENVIGISLDKAFRGQGLSARLIEQAATAFFSRFPDEELIHAYIKSANKTSARAFERAGFRLSGETDKFATRHHPRGTGEPSLNLLFVLTKLHARSSNPKHEDFT